MFGADGLMWVQPITDTFALILAAVLFKGFLRSLAKKSKTEAETQCIKLTTNPIITISRQFGSGGRTIGKEVAAKLGIPCYDSELIQKIAVECGLAQEYVEKYSEYAISDSLYENVISGRDVDGKSALDKIWFAQKKVITELAEKESCVIVGRCADYILQDVADCLPVFVYASDEIRAERIVSIYGQREEAPIKRLHDKDKKRSAYYELYTGTDWGKAENYEMCLNSGKIGIDACVEIICNLYKNK